jgi:hypothetical protein
MAEMKMKPASEGHKPKGAHGRAAVEAIGRTRTTGNFKKIEESKGKGAAIAAYQNKLKANHNGPTQHRGSNGLTYGAHEAHSAITSQAGRGCDCK